MAVGIPWEPRGHPTEFVSLTGKTGAQLRATVSSFGRAVSFPEALSVKVRSTSMPSSWRTVFWSTVLTLT